MPVTSIQSARCSGSFSAARAPSTTSRAPSVIWTTTAGLSGSSSSRGSTSNIGSDMASPPVPSYEARATRPAPAIFGDVTRLFRRRLPPLHPGPPLRLVAVASAVPSGAHEWVSFPDPDEDRTWVFDVTFLESAWTCIFGRGCQGVLTGPAPELVQGCCSYGAHFTGKADIKRVAAAAATLTDEQWQFRHKALPRSKQRNLRFARSRQGRAARHPDGRGRMHLLEPPGFPRRTRLRPSPRGSRARKEPARAEARRLLAASAQARGHHVGRRMGHFDRAPVGPPRLGPGRRRVPLVVHRGPRSFRGHPPRVEGASSGARADGRARASTGASRGYLAARSPGQGKVGGPPKPVCREAPGAQAQLTVLAQVSLSGSSSSVSSERSGTAPFTLPRISSNSSGASHQDACSSSGPAPHSGQRRFPPRRPA